MSHEQKRKELARLCSRVGALLLEAQLLKDKAAALAREIGVNEGELSQEDGEEFYLPLPAKPVATRNLPRFKLREEPAEPKPEPTPEPKPEPKPEPEPKPRRKNSNYRKTKDKALEIIKSRPDDKWDANSLSFEYECGYQHAWQVLRDLAEEKSVTRLPGRKAQYVLNVKKKTEVKSVSRNTSVTHAPRKTAPTSALKVQKSKAWKNNAIKFEALKHLKIQAWHLALTPLKFSQKVSILTGLHRRRCHVQSRKKLDDGIAALSPEGLHQWDSSGGESLVYDLPDAIESFVDAQTLRHVSGIVSQIKKLRADIAACNHLLCFKEAKRRSKMSKLDMDDCAQVATIGLIQAVDKFDPDRGFAFGTYASHWIRHAVGREVETAGATIRIPVHMHSKILKFKKYFAQNPDASIEEISEAMGFSVKSMERIILASFSDNLASMDSKAVGPNGDEYSSIADRTADGAPSAGGCFTRA